MTIGEVCKMTGLSARTLRYYDSIGLLRPAGETEGGYRVYDDNALTRLRDVMLLRELEYPLSDIREMLDSPNYDRARAIESQIGLLKLKRARIDALIDLAAGLISTGEGVNYMDFKAFDKSKLEDYAKQAKAQWGGTEAYRQSEEKRKGRTDDMEKTLAGDMMDIFKQFGEVKKGDLASDEARALVQKLRDFITANYYDCTLPILRGLSGMYAGGGAMTNNIDAAGGAGTAEFAASAIIDYCDKNSK